MSRSPRSSETSSPLRSRICSGSCPNLSLLDWLAERTGTSVTRVRRDYTRNGCAMHCPQAHVHIQSHSGRWSLSGVRATVVLSGLLPFLQMQVQDAQALVAVGLRAPHKPATIAKMAQLGWPTPQFLSDQPLEEPCPT